MFSFADVTLHDLWWVIAILAIIALLLFIFRGRIF